MTSSLFNDSFRAVVGLLLAISGQAYAGVLAYQSKAAFQTAIAGWQASTTDFEALPAGTAFNAGGGPAGSGFGMVLSGPSAGSARPAVDDQFWTSSGRNYLGLDNNAASLEAGDALTFSFSGAVQAFGLYVIGTRDVDGGDITLSSGAFRVSNRAVADVSDGAGSYAFFLGFMSDDGSALAPVSLLVLSEGDQRLLDIDIDDVILARAGGTGDVPEPASVPLMLAAALAFGAAGKRRARPIPRLYYQREL